MTANADGSMTGAHKHVRTATLDVAYEESGARGGIPVFLMHGWPYDPRCYDDVLPALHAAGCRVIVPYLRGFGATRFLSAATLRSGQQAALGNDLREVMDALKIAGYDWGGRAACIVSALWPERVISLVTGNSYNLQNIPTAMKPASLTSAGCAGRFDITQPSGRFHRCTGRGPSPVFAGSTRSLSVRCRFQACRPV